MSFKVTARTVLHLGAELISSDGIALYELIKNSFDARSESVEIAVQMAFRYADYVELREQLQKLPREREASTALVATMSEHISDALPKDAVEELKTSLARAKKVGDLLSILDNWNRIVIADSGEGMSLDDLSTVYLTIGTRSRKSQKEKLAKQKEIDTEHPILGEKGVGRLSAMRLGDHLHVVTAKVSDKRVNTLDIDWRAFSHEEDTLIGEIDIAPVRGELKAKILDRSGTRIVISALRSDWSNEKCRRIAIEEVSRFLDPFAHSAKEKHRPQLKIFISFNGEAVRIPRVDRILFEQAHAYVTAKYRYDEEERPMLTGTIEYRLGKATTTFRLDRPMLLGVLEDPKQRTLADYLPPAALKSLGPFDVEFYWFNRRILEAVEGVGTKADVQALVNSWSGGLMLFRDGFRVNPYGSAEDDWLKLDPRAFGSGGYKVNRSQIVGRVTIDGKHNPALVDQTNREGLKNGPEKSLLIVLLQHVLIQQFKGFINKIDRARKEREIKPLNEINVRMEEEIAKLTATFNAVLNQYPQVKTNKRIVGAMREVQDGITELVDDIRKAENLYEEDRHKLTHLAGVGLMVEFIAHELGRATDHAMLVLRELSDDKRASALQDRFDVLSEELKTINKRLSILDPMATSRRQRKSRFDLTELCGDLFESHDAQFARHEIQVEVLSMDGGKAPEFNVNAVKGMMIQVIENLVSNSLYWLKIQAQDRKGSTLKITVHIDKSNSRFYFTDTGPGLFEEAAEDVFEPFVSYRRPETGRGLGLYICRQIAEYHGATIRWSERFRVHKNKLNTIEFSFGDGK